MRMGFTLIALWAAAGSAPQAFAENCGSYGFEGSENYTAAVIGKAAGKVHFKDGSGKELATYLLPNDEVVVLSKQKDSSCAVYVSNKFRETAGWLPNADLSVLPSSNNANGWQGTFVRDVLGSMATLQTLKNGRVKVDVEAYWAMSVELAKQGGTNEGGLAGEGELKAGALHIGTNPSDNFDNCEGDFRRIGNQYLLVEDNRAKLQGGDILTCAGHNVTFSGLYIKTK